MSLSGLADYATDSSDSSVDEQLMPAAGNVAPAAEGGCNNMPNCGDHIPIASRNDSTSLRRHALKAKLIHFRECKLKYDASVAERSAASLASFLAQDSQPQSLTEVGAVGCRGLCTNY